MKTAKSLAIALCLIVPLSNCSTSSLQNFDYGSEYRVGSKDLYPLVAISNLSGDSTLLWFRIDKEQLLYEYNEKTRAHESNVLIRVHTLFGLNDKTIRDSLSLKILDERNASSNQFLQVEMKIGPQQQPSFIVKTTIIDQNRAKQSIRVLRVQKGKTNQGDNFAIYKAQDQRHFYPWISEGSPVLFKHKDAPEQLYVSFYDRIYGLAKPPFSAETNQVLKYTSDSVFVVTNSQGKFPLSNLKKGHYHFQVDTNNRSGFNFFVGDKDFPKVSSTNVFLGPVRYLTMREEFSQLIAHENPKLAVEEFWLAHAGSKERARQLIKIYYSRVEKANVLFTSYKEGWKTDRGMIYIVFGAPETVYRRNDSETWIYPDSGEMPLQSFEFRKFRNPLSDDDYRLKRMPGYKYPWNLAVDAWRKGRVSTGIYR